MILRVFYLFSLLISIQSCVSEVQPTTFYLVRHAEKDLSDTTQDPPLTIEGIARAKELSLILDGISIDGCFSTYYQRNINTIAPTAKMKQQKIHSYKWTIWQPMLDTLKLQQGKTFLICGHGDNLLPMIDYLGGEPPYESLGKHEYDNLFKVVVYPDSTQVFVEKY